MPRAAPRGREHREHREHRERRDEKRKVRRWETKSFDANTWESLGKLMRNPSKT